MRLSRLTLTVVALTGAFVVVKADAGVVVPSALIAAPNPFTDPAGAYLNRYGAFSSPTSGSGSQRAIRVRLKRMYIDTDENSSGCPVGPDLSAFEGEVRRA